MSGLQQPSHGSSTALDVSQRDQHSHQQTGLVQGGQAEIIGVSERPYIEEYTGYIVENHFLGPRRVLALPLVNPSTRPPACNENLDLLYGGIYAS